MFNSLTDEERQEFREVLENKPADEEVVEEEKSEIGDENIKQEEGKEMPNEAEKDKDVERTAETEKVAEEATTPSNEGEQMTVEQTPEVEQDYNAIPLSDVVLKSELYERLDALNAKFDAVIKENADLKNALSAMKEKYEDKDFGNIAKQGLIKGDKDANTTFKETFDEYAKKFM